jgi:valyl-tRNA synthetase
VLCIDNIVLVPGYNKDLSFSKDYKMVATPHFAVQKRWKNQIFNLSYSEGYNAPTASTSFVSGGIINTVNDDLGEEKAKTEEELKYLKGFLISVEKKLSNEKFVAGAPAQVVENERKKQKDAQDKIAILEEKLKTL